MDHFEGRREWPLNGQNHERRDVIITSRTDLREMVDHGHEPTLVNIFSVKSR